MPAFLVGGLENGKKKMENGLFKMALETDQNPRPMSSRTVVSRLRLEVGEGSREEMISIVLGVDR